MLKAIQPSNAKNREKTHLPALKTPAVAFCLEVGKTTREQSLAQGKSEFYSGKDAAQAYCRAMPPLTGYQNICDFIACVSYGVILGTVLRRHPWHSQGGHSQQAPLWCAGRPQRHSQRCENGETHTSPAFACHPSPLFLPTQ